MWRTAFLGARRRPSLFFVPRPFRCASSTTPTAPEWTKSMRDAPKMPWEKVLEGGKEYGTFMAFVLTFLILFGGTVKTIDRLQEEVKHEKEHREKDVKHEKELREEAVKRAEAQVDRRVLDLLFAAEYESLRSKVDNQAKVVRDMQQAMNELKKSSAEKGASGDDR